MNVVFMGTPAFACPALESLVMSRHKLLAVVTTPDKPAGRGRKVSASEVKLRALALKLPLLQPGDLRDQAFLDDITALRADVFVIMAFRILPKKLYTIPPRGSINIHASLLPKYRGAAPIARALCNGEIETGLTSFFLKRRVDEGDIIDQESTAIGPDENQTSLAGRLSDMAGPFLLRTLDLIVQPGFAARKQDDALATPAPKITTEDCAISWHLDDTRLHNHIRAFSEQPGAFCYLNGQKIKILGSLKTAGDPQPTLDPGEMHVDKKRLFVGTGGKPLQLTRLQPEGKKSMDALSFINGYRIKPNQKLTSA